MKRVLTLLPVLGIILLSFTGCKPRYRQQEPNSARQTADPEAIYQTNRQMIRDNAIQIREMAARKGWNLTETGTGVFYRIITKKQTAGRVTIKPGNRITMAYTLSLTDEKECYSSVTHGPKRFVVEKSEAEQGLHEAVQFMCKGDSALVVIPPQKAFGFAGDGDRIPPQSILVYHIRIDSVESLSGK
jgi:FKBP-type peptidyl-prolyl cis-trans isomerase